MSDYISEYSFFAAERLLHGETKLMMRPLAIAAALTLVAPMAEAQAPLGWGAEVTGFVAHQGAADLDGGGDVSSTRSLLRVGGLYRFASGNSVGAALSFGEQSYDFGGGAPKLWGDIHGIAFSMPMRFEIPNGPRIFLVPQVRQAYESGASGSDSTTYGIFATASWQVSDTLRIGPGFGAFSELEGDGVNLFPVLLVDWQITNRWNLSTGTGVAATQGPGLRLSYAYSDALDFGIGVRYESAEFRLDGTGLAPGGVGEDSNIPVVLSVNYAPNPGISISGFLGAAFDGEIRAENANGTLASKQSYDTAPVGGLSLRLRF